MAPAPGHRIVGAGVSKGLPACSPAGIKGLIIGTTLTHFSLYAPKIHTPLRRVLSCPSLVVSTRGIRNRDCDGQGRRDGQDNCDGQCNRRRRDD